MGRIHDSPTVHFEWNPSLLLNGLPGGAVPRANSHLPGVHTLESGTVRVCGAGGTSTGNCRIACAWHYPRANSPPQFTHPSCTIGCAMQLEPCDKGIWSSSLRRMNPPPESMHQKTGQWESACEWNSPVYVCRYVYTIIIHIESNDAVRPLHQTVTTWRRQEYLSKPFSSFPLEPYSPSPRPQHLYTSYQWRHLEVILSWNKPKHAPDRQPD